MSVLMHGVIEYHGWLCATLGIGIVAPAWMPDWVPGLCRYTELWKNFEDTAAAIEGRRALLAKIEQRGVTLDIHIEPERGCA